MGMYAFIYISIDDHRFCMWGIYSTVLGNCFPTWQVNIIDIIVSCGEKTLKNKHFFIRGGVVKSALTI